MKKLSRSQAFARRIVSAKRFADIEAESRKWMITGSCGFQTDVWATGGIRYKARGTRKTFARCPHCGKRHWFSIRREG